MSKTRNFDRFLALMTAFILSFTAGFAVNYQNDTDTYAASENGLFEESDEYFVTFFDEGEKLTVRTGAKTVQEALERANIEVSETDKVSPALDAAINTNNFFINIYRSRPMVVKDGAVTKYVMSANTEPVQIAKDAGFTIYDGDEVKEVANDNFLETGVATVYAVTRNGGRRLTEEVEIPFAEEEVTDYTLAVGMREVRQLGEVGAKRLTYEAFYENNVETRRDLVNAEILRQPVNRIVAVGAKKSVPPEAAVCAGWAREAGVSEADLSAAIDLIYHESGCRVDATNASSGAYGIPQALPGGKMATVGADWQTNPVTQIKWMINYVNGRYGGWTQALAWWYAHGWY
ncbi:G5 domain-containing protein [Candidatus Saccharibacteria bacterium]|nr:G5 domain-containing protein [Candidatus Saccharibacteria bacterium]